MIVNNTTIEHAGHTVFYTLNEVSADVLRQAAQAHGLDTTLLPAPPTPSRLLGRAVKAAARRAGRALGVTLSPRPIKRRGAWQIDLTEIVAVDSKVSTGLVGKAVCRAVIRDGALVVDDLGDSVGYEVAKIIREEYEERIDLLTGDDVSLWVADRLLPGLCAAVKVRPSGGVYYVPPSRSATLSTIKQVIESAKAGTVYTLATVKDDDAASAVLDFLTADMKREIEAIQAQIDAGVGTRALAARTADCEVLRQRVKAYESLLGKTTAKVIDLLDDTEDALVDATLELERQKAAAQQ